MPNHKMNKVTQASDGIGSSAPCRRDHCEGRDVRMPFIVA